MTQKRHPCERKNASSSAAAARTGVTTAPFAAGAGTQSARWWEDAVESLRPGRAPTRQRTERPAHPSPAILPFEFSREQGPESSNAGPTRPDQHRRLEQIVQRNSSFICRGNQGLLCWNIPVLLPNCTTRRELVPFPTRRQSPDSQLVSPFSACGRRFGATFPAAVLRLLSRTRLPVCD
jgi:hypothetical protein